MKYTYFSLGILFSLLITLGGCGSSSSPSGDTSDKPAIHNAFYRLADTIEGITYQCGNKNGSLAKDGKFTFTPGEDCYLSVGKWIFRSISSDTLYDGAVILEDDLPNIQLLASLDNDANPENGIKILPEVAATLPATLFTNDPDQLITTLVSKLSQIPSYQGTFRTNQTFYDATQVQTYFGKMALNDLKNRFVGKSFYLPEIETKEENETTTPPAKPGYVLLNVTVKPNLDWELNVLKNKNVQDLNLSSHNTIASSLESDGFHMEDDSVIGYIADLPDRMITYSYDEFENRISEIYPLFKSYDKALAAYETLQKNDPFQTAVAGKTFYMPLLTPGYDGNTDNAIFTIHFSPDATHITLTLAQDTIYDEDIYFINNTIYLKEWDDEVFMTLIGKTDKYLHIFAPKLPMPNRFFTGLFYTKTDAAQYLKNIMPTE